MLNVLRQRSLEEQDLYSDFRQMRYSERYEVVFKDADLQHHDLSTIGRGVSTVLKIRGPSQGMVLDRHAAMHRMVLAFLDHFIGGRPAASLAHSLAGDGGSYEVTVLPATVPAASLAEVVESFSKRPAKEAVTELRKQHAADPESPTFTAASLAEMAYRLTRQSHANAALELLAFAAELHPDSKEVTDAISNAKKGAGH